MPSVVCRIDIEDYNKIKKFWESNKSYEWESFHFQNVLHRILGECNILDLKNVKKK